MYGDIPYINLENFRNEEFENSQYVLTSPLSLKACSNLSVKPNELLFMEDGQESNEKFKLVFEEWKKLKKEERESAKDIEINGNRIYTESNHQILNNEPIKERRVKSKSTNCSRHSKHNEDRRPISRSSDIIQKHWSSRDNKILREFEVQERRNQIRDQKMREQQELAMKIAIRQERAERNRSHIKKEEYRELIEKRRIANRKNNEALERKKQLEEEVELYYQDLARFRYLTLKTAEEKTHERIELDRRRISDSREKKEAQVLCNRYILAEHDDYRTKELQQRIVECDRQTDIHEQQKLERILESRLLAGEAEKMRAEIRSKFGLDTFDRKAEQARLVNYIMSKS